MQDSSVINRLTDDVQQALSDGSADEQYSMESSFRLISVFLDFFKGN